jgi:hypothetical protein
MAVESGGAVDPEHRAADVDVVRTNHNEPLVPKPDL